MVSEGPECHHGMPGTTDTKAMAQYILLSMKVRSKEDKGRVHFTLNNNAERAAHRKKLLICTSSYNLKQEKDQNALGNCCEEEKKLKKSKRVHF